MDPTDPRAVRTRRRVLDAAAHLLAERGVDATSMDAVATAAGISRSTLYRHWPERLPLLLEAIEHLGEPYRREGAGASRPGEGLVEALQRHIGGLGDGLRSPEWGAVAADLAAAADRDPDLAEVHGRYVVARRETVIARLREARDRGEVPAATDLDWAVSVLVGPLYYHRLILHRPMTEDEVAEHVRRVVDLLGPAGHDVDHVRRDA